MTMSALLEALHLWDEEAIDERSKQLLLTRQGTVNQCQVNEFEHYAPCKIVCSSTGDDGKLKLSALRYGGKTHYYN